MSTEIELLRRVLFSFEIYEQMIPPTLKKDIEKIFTVPDENPPIKKFDLDYLKSRINPAYAYIEGTESYERRLCVEEIERLNDAIWKTIIENPHLCDGEQCTLIHLKKAVCRE